MTLDKMMLPPTPAPALAFFSGKRGADPVWVPNLLEDKLSAKSQKEVTGRVEPIQGTLQSCRNAMAEPLSLLAL